MIVFGMDIFLVRKIIKDLYRINFPVILYFYFVFSIRWMEIGFIYDYYM